MVSTLHTCPDYSTLLVPSTPLGCSVACSCMQAFADPPPTLPRVNNHAERVGHSAPSNSFGLARTERVFVKEP